MPPQLYELIVRYLGPHGPDGLLAFVLFAGAAGLIFWGIDPYISIGFAIAMYLIYSRRRGSAERHQERMAEAEVKKTAIELERYRTGQLARLEKEKLKSLPKPSKGEGTNR